MASSIELFQFVQKFHQTIGICRPQTINHQKSSINSRNKVFLSFSSQFAMTTVAFCFFEVNSMYEYGFSCFILISVLSGIIIYFNYVWQVENTFNFIQNCERFIEKRVHSATAYRNLIGNIELFNKFLCFAICGTDAFIILSALPYIFVRYYIYDMGEKAFQLFAPAWYPFSWKTPFGYLVAFFSQFTGVLSTATIYAAFLNLVFGSCWLFIFIAEDITNDVVAFNTDARTWDGNDTKLKKRFCDLIKSFSEAKQCIMDFNRINKYPLFTVFSWNMLGLASILVSIQFELWDDDSTLFETIPLFLMLILVILYTFLLCEPGAIMATKFEKICDKFGQCDWYMMPIDLQRMYVIFLSDTQNSVKIFSYADIICERETSKKIINKAFSYFMAFRNVKT